MAFDAALERNIADRRNSGTFSIRLPVDTSRSYAIYQTSTLQAAALQTSLANIGVARISRVQVMISLQPISKSYILALNGLQWQRDLL